MSLVRGENVLLEFYDSGEWKPYACARSCSLTTTTELIETTVTGGGKYKHFTPTVNSFTGNCDGIVSLGNLGMLTLYNLRQMQLGHVLQRVRFTRTAEDGVNVYVDTVDFYITSVQDTSSFDNVSSFTVEMQGTGVLDQSLITPPIIITKVKRFEYTGAGGEVSFTEATIINKDILSVVKDGLGQCGIITAGSPASKEVKYTTSTGGFEFAVEFEVGEQAYVLYQDL
jgi:hypothetical protein